MVYIDRLCLILGVCETTLSFFFAGNACLLWFSCAKHLSLRGTSNMESFVRLRNLGLLFIILCSIALLCLGIANMMMGTIRDWYNPHIYATSFTLYSLSVVISVLAIATHPLFLMTRLHNTFKQTCHEIGDRTRLMMNILTILVLAILSFAKTLMVADTLDYIPFDLSVKADTIVQNIEFVSWIILGLQQLFIANLFSSKLLSIILEIGKFSSSIVLDRRQNELLTIISKQTLLSRIESSVLLVFVVWKVVIVIMHDVEWVIAVTDYLCFAYLICVSITIQLSFVFGDKYYHHCCFKCHQCYVKKYEKQAMKKYNKRQESQDQDKNVLLNSSIN